MPQTLGVHLVKSAFGQWLPGDPRGHWSTAWDEKLGHVEPHTLHEGDPVRQRMAAERMQHPSVSWTPAMIESIATTLERCADESPWNIAALAIEPTHLHALIIYASLDFDRTTKWLAQQMTKAVHAETSHAGPVFAKGKWATFVFDQPHWDNTARYIQHHPGHRPTNKKDRG
ncbi:MAG: hypothetical protein AAF333_18720 [Planctomycetota bacterium]